MLVTVYDIRTMSALDLPRSEALYTYFVHGGVITTLAEAAAAEGSSLMSPTLAKPPLSSVTSSHP